MTAIPRSNFIPLGALIVPANQDPLYLVYYSSTGQNLVFDSQVLAEVGIDYIWFGQPRYLTDQEINTYIPANSRVAQKYRNVIGYQRRSMFQQRSYSGLEHLGVKMASL